MIKHTAWLLFAILLSLPVLAQETDSDSDNTDETGLRRFWELNVPDGGNFLVALDKIANVSKHTYLLDSAVIINEITIDTTGNSLCRIYQISPVSSKADSTGLRHLTERAMEASDRVGELAGANPAEMVQKTYPTTTHAKTIEYRVRDKGTLDSIYSSLRKAWIEGKGRKFTVK